MPHEHAIEPRHSTHAAMLARGGTGRFLHAHEVAELRDPRRFIRALIELAAVACFFGVVLFAVGVWCG